MFQLSFSLRLKKFFLNHRWIEGLGIFVVATALCSIWISGPVFSDPDTFYHMKMAQLMLEHHGPITDFPWLAFTTLTNAYVDHHLLYHVILMPFVWLLGEVVGIKLATTLLFGCCVTLFYAILRSLRVPYAGAFALILLCTNDFAFRLSLAKAPSIGFLFLLGGYALIVHHKHRLLTLLAFFFVWAYGGFLLLPIVAGLHAFISFIKQQIAAGKKWLGIKPILRLFMPLWATLTGIVAGLLLHPSFPKHFQFYWQQIVQIGLVNYQDIIGVGGEWYPEKINDLLTSPILLTGLLVVGCVYSLARRQKRTAYSNATWTAVIMATIFFFFTLKSQRYIEYYIPWGYLAAALMLSESGALHMIKDSARYLRGVSTKPLFVKVIAFCAILYLSIFIPGIMLTNVMQSNDALHQGVPIARFAGAMDWLRDHSTKGDILFHNDWDDFPMLFNGVTRLRYIVGLDPTFMYTYNADLYWKWVHITTGEQTDHLFEIIHDDFNARFVLVDSDHPTLYRNIINDGRFALVYHDDESTIFRVPRTEEDPSDQTTLNDQDPESDQASIQ